MNSNEQLIARMIVQRFLDLLLQRADGCSLADDPEFDPLFDALRESMPTVQKQSPVSLMLYGFGMGVVFGMDIVERINALSE